MTSITAEGLEVLYGDTDSLFVRSRTAARRARRGAAGEGRGAVPHGERAPRRVYVKEQWGVESRLELEFETVYRRFFLPPMRTFGGPTEDDEEERRPAAGPRATRACAWRATGNGWRSWAWRRSGTTGRSCAHALQRDLLGWVFHDVPPAEIADRMRALLGRAAGGRRDDLLAYRRSLRKPVEAYTKSSPPHVRAAAQLPPEERTGMIRYVWTT
ncbi:MAG: hypothetical protein MZV70_37380 [Desulfobacterales bacterium]|nr:hypothetical protein [Desulfobacterales bacterium]